MNSRVDAVCSLCTEAVGNQYVLPEDFLVQIMVHEPHMFIRRQWPARAVHAARKVRVRRAEGRFPDLVYCEWEAAGATLAVLTISNCGRMKSTEPSAPELRKTMTRLPWPMSSPSVGQSARRTGREGGTYARGVIPARGQ